jgi:hypothetical protein
MAVLVLEPAQVPAATSLLPNVEVPVPPPTVEVQGPPPTAEVVESSSARVFLTVEEMMDLEMCWLLMVKIRQPSHEFTFGVGISFIPYPLVLTPVV